MVGLIAVAAGFVALGRYREIGLASRPGQLYVWFTVATCITGFFIFHRGGFGKPHALGVITLVVLAIAIVAERHAAFGNWSRYVAVISYSLTLFFHFIPGFTETLTRLPSGQPWATGPEDPRLAAIIGVAFLLFLVGAVSQVMRIRSSSRRVAGMNIGKGVG